MKQNRNRVYHALHNTLPEKKQFVYIWIMLYFSVSFLPGFFPDVWNLCLTNRVASLDRVHDDISCNYICKKVFELLLKLTLIWTLHSSQLWQTNTSLKSFELYTAVRQTPNIKRTSCIPGYVHQHLQWFGKVCFGVLYTNQSEVKRAHFSDFALTVYPRSVGRPSYCTPRLWCPVIRKTTWLLVYLHRVL